MDPLLGQLGLNTVQGGGVKRNIKESMQPSIFQYRSKQP
jgi:hypothetical protein